jgi:hypothetical protein
MREGDKGVQYFYYILFTHLGFSWESGYISFLGGMSCGVLLHVIVDDCIYVRHYPSYKPERKPMRVVCGSYMRQR